MEKCQASYCVIVVYGSVRERKCRAYSITGETAELRQTGNDGHITSRCYKRKE